MVLKNFNKTILISLKAYDETAAIRVLLYSNKYLDIPTELIDQVNFAKPTIHGQKQSLTSDENFQFKNINKLI